MGMLLYSILALSVLVALIWQGVNPNKKINSHFAMCLMAFVVTTVALVGFPLIVILVASNGSIDILHLRYLAGWADHVAVICDTLIPFFLVGFPWWLSGQTSWEKAHEETKQVLPKWLAAFAAATTAIFIFALHFFRGGQLAKLNPALVVAASLATVTLLLPFYGQLAQACLERKLNPAQWWKDHDQLIARTDVSDTLVQWWKELPLVQWWTRRSTIPTQVQDAGMHGPKPT